MIGDHTAVAVVGATGFVGSAVTAELTRQGFAVLEVTAPRLQRGEAGSAESISAAEQLTGELAGVAVVVNAAGLSDATGADERLLMGANAALPGVLARVTAATGARLVHISSAAVQGRAAMLDASMHTDGFSPYSRSKIAGEQAVIAAGARYVIYRPPGVHAVGRGVSRSIAKLARLPVSSVAGSGNDPSPQALLENVSSAIAYLATCPQEPPTIVTHPTEGVTTGSLLFDLGGRRPKRIPVAVARTIVRAAFILGRSSPRIAGNARRLEMLWFGQKQVESWLSAQGWQPPIGPGGWRSLGSELAREAKKDLQREE